MKASRIAHEKKTVELMIRLYCRKKEKNTILCADCEELLRYAHARLDHCPFGEKKSHIGKRVNEFSMIEDQKYILSQILHAAKIKKPDGILLSGDIYDSTIPSAEAVQVFDAFLTELSVERIPAFIISGNHDSAERLAFGSSLMGKSGIYFSRVYDGTIEKIPLQDAYGTVWIHLLPFLRPAVVRHALPERAEEVSYAADAVRIALEQ